MENNIEDPQKIKNRTIIWSRNSTSGYLSKENMTYNSQDMEVFINRSMNKEYVAYIHTMEYYSAI